LLLKRLNGTLPPSQQWSDIYAPHGAEGSVDPFIQPTMSPDQLNSAGDGVDWDREVHQRPSTSHSNADLRLCFPFSFSAFF
jgi:hypothetical protein